MDECRIDLGAIEWTKQAVRQLEDMAAARDVRIEVERGLPALLLDAQARRDVRTVRARARHLDDELGARGLGLGLPLVRECMDAMGGWVTVESIEGEGTTFTVEWPPVECLPTAP